MSKATYPTETDLRIKLREFVDTTYEDSTGYAFAAGYLTAVVAQFVPPKERAGLMASLDKMITKFAKEAK